MRTCEQSQHIHNRCCGNRAREQLANLFAAIHENNNTEDDAEYIEIINELARDAEDAENA
jgi:hypothetical protein